MFWVLVKLLLGGMIVKKKQAIFEKRQENQLYNVNEVFVLTTYRKVMIDEETKRYITEYFAGFMLEGSYQEFFSEECYQEFFSGVIIRKLNGYDPQEFGRLYAYEAFPLSRYIDTFKTDKQTIFNLLIKLNSYGRSSIDID